MTITLTREEAQQVLDALEGVKDMAWDSDTVAGRKLIETLRARLAQPEPEPVAFMDKFGQVFNPAEGQCYIRWGMRDKLSAEEVPMPLYTAPPQPEWQGLTDEEVLKEFWKIYTEDDVLFTDVERAFYRAIEAKLKEKNA